MSVKRKCFITESLCLTWEERTWGASLCVSQFSLLCLFLLIDYTPEIIHKEN